MTPLLSGLIAIAVLLILVVAGVPIAIACAAIGFFGLWIDGGLDIALNIMGTMPLSGIAKYVLVVLPLFILMGHFAGAGGYVHDFFKTAHKWFGSLRGALAMSTMLTSAALGAVSGSSIASAALMAKVAGPEMVEAGYDKSISAGCVAMGGTLSAMIPPSLTMVFYATLADISIGDLLIAGVFPGLLTAFGWMITIYILVLMRPLHFPRSSGFTFKEKAAASLDVWPIALLVIVVLGGLYIGIFTATEAAGVGVVATLLLLFVKKRFSWKVMEEGILGVARTSGSIFIIIAGVFIFSVFLAHSGFTVFLARWFSALPISRYLIIAGFMLLYVILGTFIDAMGMMAITVPILLPVIVALGFDPVWWGVMVVKGVEIGLATPPFGLNVFTVKSVMPEVELPDVFRGAVPFLIAEIPMLLLLIAFPQIALFLPRTMRG